MQQRPVIPACRQTSTKGLAVLALLALAIVTVAGCGGGNAPSLRNTVKETVRHEDGQLVARITLSLALDSNTGVPNAVDTVSLGIGWTYTTTGPIEIGETPTTFSATRTYVFTPAAGGESITRTVTVTLQKPVTGAG